MDALEKYVADLKEYRSDVPDFSLNDGRTEAKVLFLLRDPGNSGAAKTNVVDRDNPGPTAKHFREANDAVGLNRKVAASWNTIPWPITDDSSFSTDLKEVRQRDLLKQLVELFPKLEVVVLLGNDAHEITKDIYALRLDLHVLHGPHPRLRGGDNNDSKEWLENTVRKAHKLVEK